MQNVIENVAQPEALESVIEQEQTKSVPNKLANVWLALNFVIIVLTLICTAVLVAWPIVAKLAATFTEM